MKYKNTLLYGVFKKKKKRRMACYVYISKKSQTSVSEPR